MVHFGLGPFFRKSQKNCLHRFIIKINQKGRAGVNVDVRGRPGCWRRQTNGRGPIRSFKILAIQISPIAIRPMKVFSNMYTENPVFRHIFFGQFFFWPKRLRPFEVPQFFLLIMRKNIKIEFYLFEFKSPFFTQICLIDFLATMFFSLMKNSAFYF